MRVLVITNMYPRDEDPSYGIFVAEQLRALREAGVDAQLHYIEGYRTRLAYIKAPRRLRRLRGDYDVYHAHHTFAAAAALFAGVKPLVATFHEGAITTRAPYRALARWVGGKADARVAVSPAIARALSPLRCDVIPIGVDLTTFRPRDRFASRDELGLRADAKYVMFPTNPARPEKRFDLAQEAVEIVRGRNPAVELLVLPPSSRPRVAAYFGAADVVLVSSDFESGPLTVKEGIASGRPVVTRRVGDVDFLDLCQGCVVVGGSPGEIAEGISRALAITDVDATPVRAYEQRTVTSRLIALYERTTAKD